MKIWAQSCAAMGREPIWAGYDRALAKHVKEVAGPGTVVDLHGVTATAPGIDRYRFAEHIETMEVVRNAMRAEKEGYDAFVMMSTIDAGYYEVREVVSIPAAFITEASLHQACQLAPRFAFFTHHSGLLLRVEELARRYGLAGRMVPGASLGVSYTQFHDMYTNPAKYVDMVMVTGRKLAAQGADILVPVGGPFNMYLVEQGVKEIDGAPLLDVCAVAIMTAEMMVRLRQLGINRSRRGVFFGPSAQELEVARQLYGAK